MCFVHLWLLSFKASQVCCWFGLVFGEVFLCGREGEGVSGFGFVCLFDLLLFYYFNWLGKKKVETLKIKPQHTQFQHSLYFYDCFFESSSSLAG